MKRGKSVIRGLDRCLCGISRYYTGLMDYVFLIYGIISVIGMLPEARRYFFGYRSIAQVMELVNTYSLDEIYGITFITVVLLAAFARANLSIWRNVDSEEEVTELVPEAFKWCAAAVLLCVISVGSWEDYIRKILIGYAVCFLYLFVRGVYRFVRIVVIGLIGFYRRLREERGQRQEWKERKKSLEQRSEQDETAD